MTGRTLPGVATGDMYRGVMPFIALQVIVLGLVIAYPQLLMRDAPAPTMDSQAIERAIDALSPDAPDRPLDDPMRLLLEQLKDETQPPR